MEDDGRERAADDGRCPLLRTKSIRDDEKERSFVFTFSRLLRLSLVSVCRVTGRREVAQQGKAVVGGQFTQLPPELSV